MAKSRKKKPVFKLEPELCKGCRYCVDVCPKALLRIRDRTNKRGIRVVELVNEAECLLCKKCELICPEMAISMEILQNDGCEEG